MRHPRLRATAAQTLVQFTLPLTLAIILLIPGQPALALGLELIATAVATATVQLDLARKRRLEPADRASRVRFVLAHRSANLVRPLFCTISGSILLAGAAGPLYWLVPAVLIALLPGILNAWGFLIADPRS